MDIPLPAAGAPKAAAKHPSHFFKFMEVAMILAILTGLEIVIIWLPFGFWPIFWTLMVLSLAKFIYVIWYFMHLKWDKRLCTWIFLIGLVISGGTGWALHLLFEGEDSKPYEQVSAGAPLQG
jgi:cytochrome c oxidase subunit 4